MKKFLPIVFAASILLAACGTDKTTDTEVVPEQETEAATETEHEMVTETATEADVEAVTAIPEAYTFEDLS